jgi:hypothetical protein
LGKYYPGVTKLTEIENYMQDLCKKYKDRDGYWVANPNNENITKNQHKKTHTYTIRECIELIAKEGFPKHKYDNSI